MTLRTGTHRRTAASALAGAALVAAAMVAGAPPGSAAPGVDEVVHSANVTHVANVPKRSPFNTLSSLGTDLAFTGNFAIDGNYGGFTIYDITTPSSPVVASQVSCPGAQNDVSVSGNLLFLSTDSPRTTNSCQSSPSTASNANSWEGIKIFNITDKRRPVYVASIRTKCGSHTHTLIPDRTGTNVYLYISSFGPSTSFPNCRPPHDRISVVRVPKANPAGAAVVAEPVLFPDGGNRNTSGCHDITAYPERNIAAGACMGDGILMDITDRERPRILHRVQDNVNFSFWHSATFNNSGTKVVFTDELGGGSSATCNSSVGPNRGADGVYDITGTGDLRRLAFRGYFKIPRAQVNTENCVAHNGALIPVPGRDVMVQAWYQGGVSIVDFTDSTRPQEIGFFERGPLSATQLVTGGSWSAYYYNGHIYSSDIQKGLDVLRVTDSRLAGAENVVWTEFNAQTQQQF